MALQLETFQTGLYGFVGEELIVKGVQKDAQGNDFAEFEGVVSTEHPDLQGDIIVQKGVDWDHFKKSGVFDWEHGKEPDDIIGVPTEVRTGVICKGMPGTYVKGKLLLKDNKKAQNAHSLMKSLVGSGRQMGFSVLGKGLRDPQDRRKIIKSLFSRIALTVTPVNTYTGGGLVEVVKSLEWVVQNYPSVSFQQFQELVRKTLHDKQGLDCDAFAAMLFTRARLDGSSAPR